MKEIMPRLFAPAMQHLRRFGMPVMAGCFLAGAALAQSTEAPAPETAPAESTEEAAPAPVAVDPLDGLCAAIGRPVTKDELAGFSGYVLSGLSTPYTEVIGRFREGRTRSVRYWPDESRTAQYVRLDEREICFGPNGSDDATCGVPLVCTSGEADFVMVDENDRPYARIDKPDRPANDTPEGRNDWVAFSGGSTRLQIANERLGRRDTPARNVYENDRCKVGAGYPGLDGAFAYFWRAGNCTGPYASGTNSVIYITRDGEIKTARFGDGTGIRTSAGALYWSFARPLDLAIECANADDTRIPQAAAEVEAIVARIGISSDLNIGEPLVFSKLIEETDPYIERICGVPPLPNQTRYLFEYASGEDAGKLALAILRGEGNLRVLTAQSPAYQARAEAQRSAAENASNARRFAQYIREFREAERQTAVLRILRANGRLVNLADGVRAGDVQTLVALVDGLTIRMPWAGQNPAFSDGKFQISWSVSSSDPVDTFFQNRRQKPGWRAIERRVPAAQNRVTLRLTCYLPGSNADSLPADYFVDVEASLIRHDGNNYTLRCEAP